MLLGTMAAASCSDPSHPSTTLDTRAPVYHSGWNTDIAAFAVDDSGNVHVVQGETPDIKTFSKDGELLERWFIVTGHDTLQAAGLTYNDGHFVALTFYGLAVLDRNHAVMATWPEKHPRSFFGGGDLLDADAAGNVYVLDDTYMRVAKYGLDGSFKREWSVQYHDSVGTTQVSGIAVTAAGLVYVAELLRDRVFIYSTDGRLIRVLGQSGYKPGQLDFPQGIDIAGDYFYIADAGNFRVEKFSLNGIYASAFYSMGPETPSGLNVPRSVEVYKNNVFVMHDSLINRFDYSE